jgi:succinate dehydrogenase/fumarate reductase flavoprotein subunit
MAGYADHSYDVLVIGAGGAGLRAAIAAASHDGVTVGLVRSHGLSDPCGRPLGFHGSI